MTLLLAQPCAPSLQKSNSSGTVFNTKNHHFCRNYFSPRIYLASDNGEGKEKAIEEFWPSFCMITCSIRCRKKLLENMELLRGGEGHRLPFLVNLQIGAGNPAY